MKDTTVQNVKRRKTYPGMVEHESPAEKLADRIVLILVGLVAFCSVIPMWHVLMSSISDGKTLLTHPGMVWLPVGKISFKGYEHIFKNADIVRGFMNSILYTVSSTVLGFFLAVTAGYALSRDTKLKKCMIMIVTVPMLFGGGMVPTYMVVRALGWVNTPLAVIIPGCTNSMFIIMMMNAFMGVSPSLYEAARIDGAGHFRILFQIMMPMAVNMGSVIILNSIVGQWNSWLQASIYVTNQRSLWPLQLFIREVINNNESFLQTSNPDYSSYLVQYAVVIVASLPIILLFPFFQDKMESAVLVGGVKE